MTLTTWRCACCSRILAQLDLAPGSVVKVKCSCNAWNILQVPTVQTPAQPRSGMLVLTGK